MNVKNAPRPPNMVCSFCGGKGFQTVQRAGAPAYICKTCRRVHRHRRTAGSGQIAGPVYYRTQEP